MGMSPFALARCRKMTITKNPEGGAKIEVYDQILKKTVETYVARVDHDIERVKRAFMTRFNVPRELIFFVDPLLPPEKETEIEATALPAAPITEAEILRETEWVAEPEKEYKRGSKKTKSTDNSAE